MCSAVNGRMIRNHEEDEFIAVRVQDPRVQNEGSWNSYVDFKIFLHTNSRAFTAKTSCVRRRYREFVWLKKKLQKNAGVVPVPDLPSKAFFSFSKEDFLEKRRKGLQCFLDKVLHMTVCLSDSQLHLFLQSQLTLVHIQDCVQGHTPYTVTEAILSYASSNQGWAQEEDVSQEHTLTPVPYESMESPAPHVPSLPSAAPPTAPHTLESVVDVHDVDTVELLFHQTESPFLVSACEEDHTEAVLEVPGPEEATSPWDARAESASWKPSSGEQESHQQASLEVPCPEGIEAESALATERVVEEENPIEIAEETIPHTEIIPQPNGHEENSVPDQVRHVVSTREDDDRTESRLREDAYDDEEDDIQGHVVIESYTEIGRKEERNTDATLEVGSGDTASREEAEKTTTLREVMGEEVVRVADDDDDEEMLPEEEEVRRQDEDLDRETSHKRAPLSSGGSSLEESVTENGAPEEEASSVTNGYLETTAPREQHRISGGADTGVLEPDTRVLEPRTGDTDVLETTTRDAPSLDDFDTNHAQEINGAEFGELEEIPHLTNGRQAETPAQTSSWSATEEEDVEPRNDQEVSADDDHMESSGEHSAAADGDDVITLAAELDADAPVKCREREVYEFKADANLPVSSQETEP